MTQYLAWVNNGGKLIVFNGDGLGYFAKQLAISSDSTDSLAIIGARSKLETLNLGKLFASPLFSSDYRVKVIADYFNEDNQLYP